jgi:predicted MFS family arabinose efflux permease
MVKIRTISYEYKLIFLLFLAWGFVFLDRTSLSYLIPVISQELDLNNSQIAQINMWQTIGYAVSALIVGFISDRTGYRKRILLISVICTAVFTALSALADSFYPLLIVRTLVGMSEGPVLPMAICLTSLASKPERFGLNIGFINAGVTVISSTLGPIMVTQLVSFMDWRGTFFIVAFPSIVVALFIWKWINEVPRTSAFEKKESTNSNLSIAEVFKYRNINLCMIIAICCMSSLWIHYSFSPLYLVEIGRLSVEKMGIIMSAMGLVGLIWVIAVPFLSDFMGRKHSVILFSVISFLVPISLYFFAGNWIGALPAIFLNIIPVETVPSRLTTTATSLVMGVGEIAGSIVLGVSGSLADSYGLPVIMLIAALCTILMALFALGLIETKSKKGNHLPSNPIKEIVN